MTFDASRTSSDGRYRFFEIDVKIREVLLAGCGFLLEPHPIFTTIFHQPTQHHQTYLHLNALEILFLNLINIQPPHHQSGVLRGECHCSPVMIIHRSQIVLLIANASLTQTGSWRLEEVVIANQHVQQLSNDCHLFDQLSCERLWSIVWVLVLPAPAA